MMNDRLSNTELKRVNNKFASLLLRFLKHFMQASSYYIRFVVNKGDRSIRCFNWKISLKKSAFSALASKLNTGLINKG